jgi:hypothetical protein
LSHRQMWRDRSRELCEARKYAGKHPTRGNKRAPVSLATEEDGTLDNVAAPRRPEE